MPADYLSALLDEMEFVVKDLSPITLFIDPTHQADGDHAHSVIHAGEHCYRIEAFLKDTARAGWY